MSFRHSGQRSARQGLAGRDVAITGGARGIGLQTAKAFSERGARVLIGDIDFDGAKAAVGEVPGVRAVRLDVRDGQAFERFVDEAGELDVLVNNAGIMPLGPFLDEQEEVTRRQIEVNLWGVMAGMRAALPGMVERGRGQIVNVASMGGRFPLPGAATYTATKAAVIGLTEAVRHELRGSGVTLTTVLPALVETELVAGVPEGRGLPAATPEQAATAIVRGVERRSATVYVPRRLRLAEAALAVAPRALVDFTRRRLDDRRVLERLDSAARRGYDERVAQAGRS
jgi:NAD(P)-dependent dehydrogenase (short-subunit alcohol dehydrogenase family)